MNHIPPIQCLVTFEAVARLRSASRAADELCGTVSAIETTPTNFKRHPATIP